MYFVLYDRFLKSIGQTYILESWSRTQRAVDFDDIRIVGEQIPYGAEPFCVVVNDKQGNQYFSGLASTPVIDEQSKKTTLVLKDYMTLLNSDIIVDWSQYSGSTLSQYLDFILSLWHTQIDIGFNNILWDVQRVSQIAWDPEIALGSGVENVQAHELVQDAINYYGLYCIPELDVYNKTLTFVFYPCGVATSTVRLSDFGINYIERSFGEYNRATVYSHDYTAMQTWALTLDNLVVKLPTEKLLVYPAKNRNFIAEQPSEDLTEQQALWNAVYDAVMGLSANRFQENIDLDLQQYFSVTGLSNIDFSYKVDVYDEQGFYKTLPVGEIEMDSSGKHIVRLGYRIQELTQEI